MRDFVTFATPALVLGIFYCLYRAATLFAGWRPAAAVVWSTDYSEAQRFDDRWGMGLKRGWHPFTDGEHSRLVGETVHYRDEHGERHVAEVRRRVRRGRRPDGAHVIWYDTANPDNATAFGPAHWLGIALSLGLALVMLINAAMHVRGF